MFFYNNNKTSDCLLMIIIKIYIRTGDKIKNNQSKYVNEVFLFRIESFIVGACSPDGRACNRF